MQDVETFRRRWNEKSAVSSAVDPAWALAGERLLDRHQESHRCYHGVNHIVAVLEVLDSALELPSPLPPSLTLAAFFHDAIYDPQAADNEAASAVLARQELHRLWVPTPIVNATMAIIEATANHIPDDTPWCAEFLDADLSILGAPEEIYQRYVEGIQHEYAHVAPDDFRTGRARILSGFLERDQLYFTAAGRAAFEAAARRNIAAELEQLRRPAAP